jgi:hypothetical protein
LNALRLVLGTRLDISEESRPEDFEGDERGAALYASYAYLTWLQGWVIEALDEGMRADGPGEHAP